MYGAPQLDRGRWLFCVPIWNVCSSFIDHLYKGNLQKQQAKRRRTRQNEETEQELLVICEGDVYFSVISGA